MAREPFRPGVVTVGRVLVAHQPNYLPYLGFLHKSARADVIVLQDDLKYIKNDFGNRNRVQAEDDWRWLSIPVKANNSSTFADVVPADPAWPRDHANILRSKYVRAAHKARLEPYLEALAENAHTSLAQINTALIVRLFVDFGITAPIEIESGLDLGTFTDPNERLIALCRRFDCDTYLSGAGAHAYIDEAAWRGSGITLAWSDYEPTVYDRGVAPWIANLSALDAIAHAEHPLHLIS